MSFDLLAQDYFDKNLIVVPITPGHKAPLVKDWNSIDFEKQINKYKGWGIGIKPGKSGLMALDIDVEDEEKKKKIQSILPPIYCGRKGSKKRLPTIFFKYDEKFEDLNEAGIELIINARQCVLPPTMHPDGHPYEWVGADLLSADTDMIPELDESLLKRIVSIAGEGLERSSSGEVELVNAGDHRCMSGSHSKLSQIAVAMVLDGKGKNEIVERLLEYDSEINPHVSYFLCPSRDEWKVQDRMTNCILFVDSVCANQIKKRKIDKLYLYTPSIEFIKAKITEKERVKLPRLRGVAQEMFEIVYANSPMQRSRLAFASSLSIMGTLLANKVKCEELFTNLYIMIVANSASGKNTPIKYPTRLFNEINRKDLIGVSDLASDNTILMGLDKQRERLDSIDEGSKLLATSGAGKDYHLSKIADIYAELYTSPGMYFGGKKAYKFIDKKNDNENGVLGACDSPCISILTATTFTDIQNHLSLDLIDKGLGGRFLYFSDDGFKPQRRGYQRLPISNSNIREFSEIAYNLDKKSSFDLSLSPMQLELTKGANAFLDDCMSSINSLRKNCNNKTKAVVGRFYENLIKLAMIDHVSQNYKTLGPITKNSCEWAFNTVTSINKMATQLIEENVSESYHEKELNKFRKVFRKNNGVLTKTEVSRKLQSIPAEKRDRIIKELIESEYISFDTNTKTGKVTYTASQDFLV